MRSLWQDPQSVLGQGLGVSRLCLGLPILSMSWVLLPPLTMKWDKGILSPLILNEIGYHFVAKLGSLSSAVPSGTTYGKCRIQRICGGTSISSLMVSWVLSRDTRSGVGWAALGCSVVRTRGRAKGFICLCQQAVDMTRARVAGMEWGHLFGIAFCLAFLSAQCVFLAQIIADMLSWIELAVRVLFNRNEVDERLKKAWSWWKIRQNYQWRWWQK